MKTTFLTVFVVLLTITPTATTSAEDAEVNGEITLGLRGEGNLFAGARSRLACVALFGIVGLWDSERHCTA